MFPIRTALTGYATLIAIGMTVFAGQASGQAQVPVPFGGEAEEDACGGLSEVARLDLRGDNFLAVRSGPGTSFAILDKLKNGQPVFVCAAVGNWRGIVYSKSGQTCGTGVSIMRRRAYDGPCLSGWVYRSYLEDIAG